MYDNHLPPHIEAALLNMGVISRQLLDQPYQGQVEDTDITKLLAEFDEDGEPNF
jgi:hypothetical protein